jgi:hypothetical protein
MVRGWYCDDHLLYYGHRKVRFETDDFLLGKEREDVNAQFLAFVWSLECHEKRTRGGGLLRQSVRTIIPDTEGTSLKRDTVAGGLEENPQPILESWMTAEVISNVRHVDLFDFIRRAVVELQPRVAHPFEEL